MQLERHTGLHEQLGQALRFAPTYHAHGLELSAHLPMLLSALARLGATDAQLKHQAVRAATRLEPARPLRPGLRLADWLPRLLTQAPEAMAFHSAIRMAYALETGHVGEQAAALDAWVDGARDLLNEREQRGPSAATVGKLSLRETLDRVRADPSLAMSLRQGTTIMSDLAVAQALPGFDAYLPLARLNLGALAEASLALYLSGRDFTALHLVTGLHAVRVLLEAARARRWDVDEGQVLRSVWRAWLAAYLAVERPALAWAAVHAGLAGEADWQAQLPALYESSNEHRIKLADAAREEWRSRGWPGYALCLQAAGAAK